MNVAILLASGKSGGIGSHADVDIGFLTLGRKPVLAYSLLALEQCPDIEEVIVVVRKEKQSAAKGMAHMFGCPKVTDVLVGSGQRMSSVAMALDKMDDSVKIVSVLEVSRPCVSSDLVGETIKAAKRYGSGVAAAKITDTIRITTKGNTSKTPDGSDSLWIVQSPQSFKIELLKQGLSAAKKKRATCPDEATMVELVDPDGIRLVPSTNNNFRILQPADLAVAASLLNV